MDKQEEIRIKNQKAEEAMRRARQAQLANEKMQRELQAAARELARHQELARKASMQEMAARKETAAADSRRSAATTGTAAATGNKASGTASIQDAVSVRGKGSESKTDAVLKQQEASREAARQAMIYEAAKRRAEKKEAAKKAAELVAAQKAAEKKVHHTSPETKELQNILLQQIAEIMDEKDQEEPSSKHFGDLVIMDVHGEELQPESSASIEKKLEKERIARERDAAQDTEPETKLETWGRMGNWFLTFCWMHIPLVGFWYMVVVALRKKTPKEKKAFARAFILYRILVLILACTLLYIFYRMGLGFLEQILSYMEAHQ